MRKFIPPAIDRWSISESARFYSGDEIFRYMDGAGEIYLAYKFKDLLVQRYASDDKTEILVEIFDMGLPQNAFGVFTYMQGRGPREKIGQDGEYKAGLLCFWREKYFVSIKVEEEEKRIVTAVMELGKQIANMIGQDGDRPAILSHLPEGMYLENTLRYFYRYEILNNHFFLAGGNILRMNDSTECVFVRLKQDKSYLLLVQYPNLEQTDSAYNSFMNHYMPDAHGTGVIETENKKWTTCTRYKNYIIVIFDAGIKSQGIISLDTIKRRLQ